MGCPGSLGVSEGSVPAQNINLTNTTDQTSIASFYIYHPGTEVAASLFMDEIRVGTNWADVTPTNGAALADGGADGHAGQVVGSVCGAEDAAEGDDWGRGADQPEHGPGTYPVEDAHDGEQLRHVPAARELTGNETSDPEGTFCELMQGVRAKLENDLRWLGHLIQHAMNQVVGDILFPDHLADAAGEHELDLAATHFFVQSHGGKQVLTLLGI
jgi:hypothetical protein